MNKFTLQQYRDLIARLSDTKIVLCRDFGGVKNNCITVRHDIDSPDYLLKIADIEIEMGIRSTYFIKSIFLQNRQMIERLQYLEQQGFEIGLHNDCLSRVNGNPDAGFRLLKESLNKLEFLGFKVYGVSNHGSALLRQMGKNNNDILPSDLSEIGIEYEAYHLNYTCYASDIGAQDNFLKLYWGTIQPEKPSNNKYKIIKPIELLQYLDKERIELLIHPEHWG